MKSNNKIFSTGWIYFIILTLFVGIRIGTSLGAFSFLGDCAEMVLTIFIQVGLLMVLPLLLYSHLNKRNATQALMDFNVKRVSGKTVLISILIGFIVFILTVIISSFFSIILSYFGYVSGGSSSSISSWSEFCLAILLIAVLPAVGEEFLHRGFLINGLSKLGIKKTIIYSSLLFGLMHMNVGQFFYASIIGAVLAAVAIFSRSIIPAMIIHFINNATSVYLSFASTRNLPGGNAMNNILQFLMDGNIVLSIIFIITLVALLVVLLFYLLASLLNISAKESAQRYAEKATIEQMRNHVLGEETPAKKEIFRKDFLKLNIRAEDSYDFFGFYMFPQIKMNKFDSLFLNASILLGALVTFFTFIWGTL